MVIADTNLYIHGGTAQGLLMIPNIESFKKFCKKTAGMYFYMDKIFKNEDLILIDFPAYFSLNNDENKWIKISKEICLKQINETIYNCEEKIKILEIFKNNISD